MLCLLIIIVISTIFHVSLWNYSTTQAGKEDIYYIWLEGKRLLAAQNPYERVLSGNLRDNQKYATYFPLFYILSYSTQLFGLRDYSSWLFLWRHIFLLFNLGIASVIFYTFYQKKLTLFAVFSALFWSFNRWTIYVTKVAQIDFIPILFLIISLLIFRRYRLWSLILFSLSLALKQIAIFLVPLYLIWVWQSESNHRVKKTVVALALIVSIPLLTSLPFIFWNTEGLLKSVLFSATRKPSSHFNAPALDTYIRMVVPSFVGIKAKLPMLFLMCSIYFVAFQRNLGMYMSSLLTMLTFIDFNSVLFTQYMCWIVPLISLAVCDSMKSSDNCQQ